MNILLLHGALGTQKQLAPISEALPGYNVRRLEFRGHGEKELPDEGLSFEIFLRDIRDALNAAGWAEAHLFGYSMGGYAALLYAHHFPERVLSVATLGTKIFWDRDGLERELRMLDPQRMKEKVPKFAMELLVQHGADRWEALVHATGKLITGLFERPLIDQVVLQNVKCPVLLCVGDRDRTAVPEHTLQAASRMQEAGTLVLPFTSHAFEDTDLHALMTYLLIFWDSRIDGDMEVPE